MNCTKTCHKCERRPDGSLCDAHAESWARTQGLISTLALPPTRRPDGKFVPLGIEVETPEGDYEAIETMVVDAERIVITTTKGKRIDRTTLQGVPKWKRTT